MEKKRIGFYALAKPAFIAAFVLLSYTVTAQKMQTLKGYCGAFFESMAHLYKVKQAELDFYHFKPGQTIASIGAQCCHIEAAFAATTDSVTFYLEDIDSSKFRKEQTEFVWDYYSKLRGRPLTCDYKMILGDEKSTSLPENTFDKILIINSFHEFTFVTEMLIDIKKKLKPGGILYIDEALPKKPGQLHGICNLPMLNSDEMIAVFAKHGFEYVDGLDFNYRQKRSGEENIHI